MLLFFITKRKWMFLWNLMCMTYLLEFQALDLFRPSIVKIPGTGVCKFIWIASEQFFLLLKMSCFRSMFVKHIKCLWFSDLHEKVDFVACLGGDGVILHASNLFRDAVPPIVSFNLGSLGFLTSHDVSFPKSYFILS